MLPALRFSNATYWIVVRSCTRKQPFTWRKAKWIAARRSRPGREWEAYACCFCPSWHVSSHVGSMRVLEAKALALRELSGNAPGRVA